MGSPATGNSYTLGGVLQEIVGKNIRLFPILFKQFQHIQYAFFDIKQLAGQGGLSIKPKEIPGLESTITADGYQVKWLDYALFDFYTTITADDTPAIVGDAVTITVPSSAGFSVNDVVFGIKDDAGTSDEFDAVVTAVPDATHVTLKLTRQVTDAGVTHVGAPFEATLTVKGGQRVERGYWRRNDNDEIVRPASAYNYVEYSSYIQHFSRRIEFTKAELNKEYRYEQDAKNEAQKRFEYNLGVLFQEVNKAIYKGKNTAPGAGANDKMEMLGLELICQTCGTIKDLASAAKPVKELFAEFEASFRSGAIVGNEPMMMLCNDRMLSEISTINQDKIRYDKYVEELKYNIITLTTIYGEVDIIRDPMLNKLYNYSVGFILPRSMVKLWVRENQDFNPKGGITRADQSVRIYDVVHNLREKKLYDMEFEMGLIAGGLSSPDCPFRMVKNFASPSSI